MDNKLPDILKKVYKTLGSGYKENIYQRAIEIELQKEFILFHSEVICPILYDSIQVGFERADIVLYDESKIPTSVFELKSQVNSITKKEFIQLYKYLINLNVEIGYIINFIITTDSITNSNFKYLELFKLEKNHFKLYKYSFNSSNFKEYSI